MLPAFVTDRLDPAADPLGDPEILVRPEEMAVARQDFLADLGHLLGRQARIDIEIAQRAIEARDMLPHLEGLAVE